MKRILFFSLFLFIVIFSCKRTGYPKPDKLINEKEMADILYDIHLYESIYRNKTGNKDTLAFTDHDLHFSILEKHGIEDTLFLESILYYSCYPKVYENIYKDVVDRLVMLEQEDKKKDAVKIKPDKATIH